MEELNLSIKSQFDPDAVIQSCISLKVLFGLLTNLEIISKIWAVSTPNYETLIL